MNVYAEEKVTLVVSYENLVQYETVFELFKSLYNFCKMLQANQHLEYCYCNSVPHNCWLCKFSDFVIYYNVKDNLLFYRENEERLLEIVNRFHFYIKHITSDKKHYKIEDDPLQFFTNEYVWKYKNVEMKLDEVIKNDIIIFKEKQEENN